MGPIGMILSTLLLLLLVFIASLLFWQKYSRFHKLLSEIPGSPSVLLFGTIFNYVGASREEIFKFHRRNGKLHYPIWKDWNFTYAMVYIYHPDDVAMVLSNPKCLNKGIFYSLLGLWFGQGLITSSGELWQKRRKMLNPTMHLNVLKDYVGIFNKETAEFLQDLEENKDDCFNIIPLIMETTFKVILEVMGTKQDHELNRKFAEAFHESGELFSRRANRPWLWFDKIYKHFPEVRSTLKIMHGFTEKMIRDKKKFGGSFPSGKKMSILDFLLKLQREGVDIDDRGIREEFFTLTVAGYETSAMAICYTLLLLANNKKEQEDARQEIVEVLGDKRPNYDDLQQLTFLERCIKESMRIFPIVPLISRQADEDIKTCTGHIVPKGSLIAIPIYDIHRNPEIYPDPEKFDPDRFLPENIKSRHPSAYIPFSAGPRNCLGNKFAMLEVKAALCGILRKFNLEPITKPEDLDFIVNIVLKPSAGIYVQFVARQ